MLKNMNKKKQNYKLNKFQIPRKSESSVKSGIFCNIELSSQEFLQTVSPIVKKSYFFPGSESKFQFEEVCLINNLQLEQQFFERRKILKKMFDKELLEHFVFLFVKDRKKMEIICDKGLKIGNSDLETLGKSKMGVYVCKHADVLRKIPFEDQESGYLIIFKLLKGRVKLVTENSGNCRTTLEPTPEYDCHVCKFENQYTNFSKCFKQSQIYVYEYGPLSVVEKPTQLLPYAALRFKYNQSKRTQKSTDNKFLSNRQKTPAYIWKGNLKVKNFNNLGKMRIMPYHISQIRPPPVHIDSSIEVTEVISLNCFSRLLPPNLICGKISEQKELSEAHRRQFFDLMILEAENESQKTSFNLLIAFFIRKNSVGICKLGRRNILYLLPYSIFTEQRMGLSCWRADHEFLYCIIASSETFVDEIKKQQKENEENLFVRRFKSSSISQLMLKKSLGLKREAISEYLLFNENKAQNSESCEFSGKYRNSVKNRLNWLKEKDLKNEDVKKLSPSEYLSKISEKFPEIEAKRPKIENQKFVKRQISPPEALRHPPTHQLPSDVFNPLLSMSLSPPKSRKRHLNEKIVEGICNVPIDDEEQIPPAKKPPNPAKSTNSLIPDIKVEQVLLDLIKDKETQKKDIKTTDAAFTDLKAYFSQQPSGRRLCDLVANTKILKHVVSLNKKNSDLAQTSRDPRKASRDTQSVVTSERESETEEDDFLEEDEYGRPILKEDFRTRIYEDEVKSEPINTGHTSYGVMTSSDGVMTSSDGYYEEAREHPSVYPAAVCQNNYGYHENSLHPPVPRNQLRHRFQPQFHRPENRFQNFAPNFAPRNFHPHRFRLRGAPPMLRPQNHRFPPHRPFYHHM